MCVLLVGVCCATFVFLVWCMIDVLLLMVVCCGLLFVACCLLSVVCLGLRVVCWCSVFVVE